jgi:hypothetical protein
MSSQRRIDSSRANGARSRGPVTPEGRARSNASGLTHGLAASQIVLEGESEQEFDALRQAYLDDFQPRTRAQFDLVDQLAATRWRLNRVMALQTALMDHQITRQEPEIRKMYSVCDGETRAAIAYQHLCDDSRALESLNRHEARLSAELRRTLKLLEEFHQEPNPANEHPQPDDVTEPRPSGSGAESDLPAGRSENGPSHPPEPPPLGPQRVDTLGILRRLELRGHCDHRRERMGERQRC